MMLVLSMLNASQLISLNTIQLVVKLGQAPGHIPIELEVQVHVNDVLISETPSPAGVEDVLHVLIYVANLQSRLEHRSGSIGL